MLGDRPAGVPQVRLTEEQTRALYNTPGAPGEINLESILGFMSDIDVNRYFGGGGTPPARGASYSTPITSRSTGIDWARVRAGIAGQIRAPSNAPAAAMNYTPYLFGAAAIVGLLLLTRGKKK